MMRRNRWTNLAAAQVREPLRAELGTSSQATAELYIYDMIDSWGGEWGVSAADVVAALGTITSASLDLHLNSPGGDYFEGVAIYNALVRHAATVTVYVDGMAASAASVIAMAGERIVMGQGSQLMIHEPSSFAMGTAADLRAGADMLDQTGDDIAGFYAQRAGGDPATWRDAMKIETWYTAQSAVDAGLADEVAPAPARSAPAASTPVAPSAVAVSNDEQPIVDQLDDMGARLAAWELALIADGRLPAAPTETPDAPPQAPDPAPPATELPTAAVDLFELLSSAIREVVPT